MNPVDRNSRKIEFLMWNTSIVLIDGGSASKVNDVTA